MKNNKDNETSAIIRAELGKTFNIQFGGNGMTDATNLIEAGMIDSFGVVELVGFLESRFGIRFKDEDLMSTEITNVDGMTRLVEKRRVA